MSTCWTNTVKWICHATLCVYSVWTAWWWRLTQRLCSCQRWSLRFQLDEVRLPQWKASWSRQSPTWSLTSRIDWYVCVCVYVRMDIVSSHHPFKTSFFPSSSQKTQPEIGKQIEAVIGRLEDYLRVKQPFTVVWPVVLHVINFCSKS